MSYISIKLGKKEREKKDFTKVNFEQRPEVDRRTNYEISSEKIVPGRRNSRCKGPEVGLCLECFRNSKLVSVGELKGI